MKDALVDRGRSWVNVLDDPSPNAPLDWVDTVAPTSAESRAAFAALESERPRPPRRSAPGTSYDLYNDLVFRHYGDRAALRSLDGGRSRALSYADLHARSTQTEAQWQRHAVVEGKTVCWIGDVGHNFAVALVTALRMGVAFSWLPPYGSRYLEHRLSKLAPDLIVTEFAHLNRFHSDLKVLVPERTPPPADDARPKERSGRPDEIALRLFSPIREAHDMPRELSLLDLHDALLRDSLLALSLDPGDEVAAPGLDDHQWQPHLLLTTLLAGGTFWHLKPAHLRTATEELGAQFRWLGVSSKLRDVLIEKPLAGLPCKTWFRDPQNVHELQEWKRFTDLNKLNDVPAANVLVDSAQGGVLLQSVRRRGGAHSWVHPPPGRAWQLVDFASRREAVGQVGEFLTGTSEEELESTGVVLARQGLEWAFGAARILSRSGVIYPRDELLALLREFDDATGISLVALSNASSVGINDQVLLRFVPDKIEAADATASVGELIDGYLGKRFAPDRIITYPLYPRCVGDAVDHEWCAAQYRMGWLEEKRTSEASIALNTLRTLVKEVA